MVNVYFVTADGNHCNLVAVFDCEDTYMLCLPVLELQASIQDMFVSESIQTKSINELK